MRKLRKILASEGLLPSRTASAPTALAKLITEAPGYESLSSRDAMDVAKQLVKTLLTELRDQVMFEVDHVDPVITEEGDGEYEVVVGSGGGPAWGGPPGGADEEYYYITDTREFEYPRRMKFELEVRADLGGAGVPDIVYDDFNELPDEEDLFEFLDGSRLWESIIRDAFKGMWRKWLQKYAANAFRVEADAFVYDQGLDWSEARIVGAYKPFNITYQITRVVTDLDGELIIDLVLSASFDEPEIEPQ